MGIGISLWYPTVSGNARFQPNDQRGFSFYVSGKDADTTEGAVSYVKALGRPNMEAIDVTVSGGVMSFNGTSSRLQFPAIVTQSFSVPLSSAIDLPAASGSGANGGFTCTGLARLPNGNWIAGNDGHGTDDDGSTNANASVVILSPDFSAVVADVTLASLGIGSVGSVQGVAYLSASHQVAFTNLGDNKIYLLDASTFALVGESSIGVVVGLNGLGYDAELDSIIVCGNSQAIWYDRVTGAQIKTVPVTSDPTNDQIFYSHSRHSLFYTTGTSGADGKILERRASRVTSNDLISYTLVGADAIEGCFIEGNTLYILNDAGYHTFGTSPKKNRVLVYNVPVLPPPDVWPTGTAIQMFGIIRVPAAAATNARVIQTVGTALGGTFGGAALFLPNGTLSQLRFYFNNVAVNWTVPSMVTKFMFYVAVDLKNNTAELWVNGTSLGAVTLIDTFSDFIDPAPPVVGASNAPDRFFPGEITCLGATVGSAAIRSQIEGFMAWDTGNVPLLPADHLYKIGAP